MGCGYLKSLEKGIVFYGRNAGKRPEAKQPKKEYHLYLVCYNQPFAVLSRNKTGFSYQLKEESFEKLEKLFTALGVPYITDINQGDFIESQTVAKQICDCRVTIEAGEDKYNILNFGSLLIPGKVAEGIKKAFEVRGIPARVEKYGRYNTVEIPELRPRMVELVSVSAKPVEVPEPEPEPREKEIVFEQASIFELLGA